MKNHAVPSLELCIIQSGIANQYPLRSGYHSGIWNRRQADTCRGTNLSGLDRKRVSFNTLSQSLRQSMSLLPIGMRQYDRKGVASVSTNDVAVTYRASYEISYDLEHLIPSGMPETVIDDPEEIQVQQQ
jgi:hypothetical protein